jgi:predicted acylesterase/phospholipase RssA/CRP-like cAMP-binding protein
MLDEWLSAPAAYPEARLALHALEPAVWNALDRGLEPIDLHAGQTLFACGDPRDAAFLILDGRIEVTEPGLPGAAPQVRVLRAGEGVGEIGVAARGPHTGTARALDDARVARLGRIAFESLCEKYPEPMSRLADFITPVTHETLLARVICDLLGERDAAQLAALLAEVECVELKRGDVLVREGEDADRMFVVVSGRLRIVARDAEGKETIIDEIGRGDTAGERSLLTGDRCAVTVYALRDSAVGVITRPMFENLKHQYPEVMTRLTQITLRRVQRQAARPGAFAVTGAVSLAVLPVGGPRGSVPLAAFAEHLAAAISGSGGSALHLSSARLDGLLGTPGLAQVGAAHAAEPRLADWLQRQEQSCDYVIYEADEGWSPWTERCLRMADRVLMVGQGASAPVTTDLDEPLARHTDSTTTELVLLQPDHAARPWGTAAWLARYSAANHHHVRLGRPADFDSFVRRVTGRGLGLVLGGGGARGFAHIGVFRALAECGVTVDLVGGTSMGAVLSATFAMGLDYDDTMQLARQLASPLKLFDPTVPVVSFFASGKVTRVLERIYGDTQIEDLWMPCFCVSSNLTHAVAMVHRRGPLWQAVRASMAMPGIFSPILAEGDLLVDGCVLNNLPIDVMRRLNYDGPIIAVNVFPDVDLLRDYHFGSSVSGWRALVSKLNPLQRDGGAPLIFESLVRVLALNDVHQAKTKRGLADIYIRPAVEKYNILDFGAYARIAAMGYRSAMQALEEWQDLRNREGKPAESAPGLHAVQSRPRGSATASLHQTLAALEELLARREGLS